MVLRQLVPLYAITNEITAEKVRTVTKAIHLVTALGNIALAHNWLTAYLLTISLKQRLVQALHPTLPSTLQLPYITLPMATEIAAQNGVTTVQALFQLPNEERRSLLSGLSDEEKDELETFGRYWPKLEIVEASFKGPRSSILDYGYIVYSHAS